MLYQIAQFPSVSRISLFCANIDRFCDALPVISAVTNITRLALGIITRISLIIVSVVLIPFFCVKSIVDIAFGKQKYPLFRNFDLFLKTIYKLQSLWMRSFFLWRYFDKSLSRTIADSIPFLGLYCQTAYQEETTRQYLESRLINSIDNFHKHRPILSTQEAYPYYIPEGFDQNKLVYLANFKMNPLRFAEIPQEFYEDENFVEAMLDGLCLEVSYKNILLTQDELKSLMSAILEKAHQFGNFRDISLPIETQLLNPKLVDLSIKYPFILWMLPNIEFIQQKKPVTTIINNKPHLITRLSSHFLKLHPVIFHKAISLNIRLCKSFDNSMLLHAFTIREGILDDPVMKSALIQKRGLLRLVKEVLAKRQSLAQLRR